MTEQERLEQEVDELRAELEVATRRADAAEKRLVRRGLRDLARMVDEPSTALFDVQPLDVFIVGLPLFTNGAKPGEIAHLREILRSVFDPHIRRLLTETREP